MANSPTGDSLTERIVRVLETFTAARPVQSAAQISRNAELPRSTGHRIIMDLAATGLLEVDADGRVRIGMRLWELGTRSSDALRLRQTALPHMERVQAHIKEHTQLAVLEQNEALLIEQLSDPGSGSNVTRVAGRLPLHASSSGLVLLAFGTHELREATLAGPLPVLTPETPSDPTALRRKIAEVRQLGYAEAPGYIEAVSTGIAVPIFGQGDRVVAALSTVLRRNANPHPAITALRAAAQRIARPLAAG